MKANGKAPKPLDYDYTMNKCAKVLIKKFIKKLKIMRNLQLPNKIIMKVIIFPDYIQREMGL